MEFIINKNLFCKKLQIVSKAVTSKTNLPALTGLLFEAIDDKLIITGSNGEYSIKVTIDDPMLQVITPGKMLVEGRFINDRARKSNGEEIRIATSEDNTTILFNSGSSNADYALLDVEDFPEISFPTQSSPIKMSASMMKDIVKQTAFATTFNTSKQILMGVNFKISGSTLQCVATDSYRLSRKNTNLDFGYADTSIIIPAKSLTEFVKILDDDFALVELYFSLGRIVFKTEDTLFLSRLIEGNYPDTRRLIPTSFPIIIEFDRSELMDAIDRVASLNANSSASSAVKLQISEDDVITITCSSEFGAINDTLSPTNIVISRPLNISFSAQYFMDALKAFNSERVEVKFDGERSPFIFESETEEGLTELVLPMSNQ